MTITVQSGAMMKDVVEEAAKEGLALPAMIYWNGVLAAGVVSTGAHGSGLSGRGSGVYEYVVGMKLVVPAPPSQGYAKLITLSGSDPDLKAAKISLGTLEAISEISFALQPMFKTSFSASVKDDNDLEKEAESFLRASEYADIKWFPSHGKAIFVTNQVVSVDVPGDGLNMAVGSPITAMSVETILGYGLLKWEGKRARAISRCDDEIQANEDVDAICNEVEQVFSSATKGSGFLNDGKQFTGYPVIGFNHRMQASGGCQESHPNYQDNQKSCTPTKILDKNNTVCKWDRRLHTNVVFDVELRVSMFHLHEAIEDIKKIRDLSRSSLCDRSYFSVSGIFMRSVKKSGAYLGPAEDQVTLEVQTYRPRKAGIPKWNEDVFQEIQQMVIEKHRGVLHWGKSGGHLFDGVAKRAVNLEKFLEVKDRFDPSGVFSNDWTDGLFGIGGRRVEEFRDGCALDKMCKCREDKHCAPEKGYFCEREEFGTRLVFAGNHLDGDGGSFPGLGYPESDPDLKAAKISIGTLGAISEISFALQPMFKTSFSASVKDDNDLEKEAESFLRASEYADIKWFPSHGKAIFVTNQVVSVDVPGDGLNMAVGSPITAMSVETSACHCEYPKTLIGSPS
ncbi:L-gulonolactone oxidase 2 [Cryptomeria japonica]|uniref:L-gulonolactone oxidase 2 n=1 Tax=Cryptomeria japonica TaxID=3369 RepID=UPI0027DA57AE|nr:L-gulonolactone oxidase 2 [Cryptomeria japonica]